MQVRKAQTPSPEPLARKRPMRRVMRFRRSPKGMVYILEDCQHEVLGRTNDSNFEPCPECPPHA